MLRFRQIKWGIIGLILFLSCSLLLNFNKVIAQTHPTNAIEITQNNLNNDCFQTLAQADELYQSGEKEEARKLYRLCKTDFPDLKKTVDEIPAPVYNIEELGGGEKLWKNALDGIENNLDSKVYFNLVPLINIYPQFIPAYLKLSEFCQKEKEFCQKFAKEGQPKTASQVFARVTEIYPDNVDLLRARIKLLVEEEQYLEASIAARQFAIIYDDYPEAPEFKKLADDYLKEFQGKVQQQLAVQAGVSAGLGIGQAILTGSPVQAVAGLETAFMLLQGESNFGGQVALAYANNYRQKGRLVEDSEIVDYIKGLAGRQTQYMGRDFNYEFYVVKDDSFNAFALPGGKVFVNTGTILETNSEAELAGVIGHEISHAVLSHGFLKVAQSNLLGNLSQVVPLPDMVSAMVYAKHSQESERQSDILGTRVLAISGYAADGLRNSMMILKKKHGDKPTNFLATHPAPVERVRYLEKMIVDHGYDRYAFEGVKRHREIQEKIEQLS